MPDINHLVEINDENPHNANDNGHSPLYYWVHELVAPHLNEGDDEELLIGSIVALGDAQAILNFISHMLPQNNEPGANDEEGSG